MSAVADARWRRQDAGRSRRAAARMPRAGDPWLLGAAAALAALGLVMVASASVAAAERATGFGLHYALRHAVALALGAGAGWLAWRVPLAAWQRLGPALLAAALLLLAAVLLPGLGHEVNGSQRWIRLGPLSLQPSEPARLLLIVFLADHLARRAEAVRASLRGFLVPVAVIGIACALLLAEPDFGAAAVLGATLLVMLFLAGVPLGRFAALAAAVALAAAAAAVASPYRFARLTTFLNPWADPFDSGFQLTQSLIAFGRGEWLGVGLGESVQKLFYLPEAHTDFLPAVIGEELGLAGTLAVIGLYALLLWRVFAVAGRAWQGGLGFAGHLAAGVGTWIGLQAFVNLGVSMGLLPTKGLTLPLMSYGGTSLVVTCVALALVLRVDHEARAWGGDALARIGTASRGGRRHGGRRR